MKSIVTVLVVLVSLLQYELWFSKRGVHNLLQLRHNMAELQNTNRNLVLRNNKLMSQIDNVESKKEVIEGRARSDLGMIKKGELLYQTIK